MNNEELKKKIVSVLRENVKYNMQYYPEDNRIEMGVNYENLADALIAAEIGDVKEAEYRAEKAEKLKNQYCRALLNLARRYVVKTNMTLPHGNEPHSRSTDIEMLALYIMANECEQAEKELAEERK